MFVWIVFVFSLMGLKEILQREKEQYTTSENKNGNFCSFWIQRLYLQHARLDQFWMTFSWTLLTLRTFYGAVLGLSSYIFLVVSPLPPQCSLTMPYLCKYFGLCCLKGDILKRHQNHGLFFFFFNFSCAKTVYYLCTKILQGASPLMQYFGLVSFLLRICIKLEVCVWAWVPIW